MPYYQLSVTKKKKILLMRATIQNFVQISNSSNYGFQSKGCQILKLVLSIDKSPIDSVGSREKN